MILTLLFVVLTIFDCATINGALTVDTNQTGILPPCPVFQAVQNANVTITRNEILPIFQQIAHIHCDNLSDLVGPPKVLCINGQWEDSLRPRCVRRCYPPPYLKNGGVQIEGDKNAHGLFKKGATATYTCSPGFEFSPKDSEYRECRDGIWTGSDGVCLSLQKVNGCKRPKPIKNGYFVEDDAQNVGYYAPGDRLRYDCKDGFDVSGSNTQQCLDNGIWSPEKPPTCIRSADISCTTLPKVPHAVTTLLSSYPLDSIPSRAEVEIRCMNKYHNMRAPCQASTMRCIGGHWIGLPPICVVAKECPPPPEVRYGRAFNIGVSGFEIGKVHKYMMNAQITYQCFPGYEIEGNEVLSCADGCWLPSKPPICKIVDETYLDSSGGGQILISLATGTGVLLLLIVICLAIVCRRRKPLSRAVSIQPALPEPYLTDHPLLHHPDRLALIPFADSLQIGQPVLPTYEEATRDRGPGLTSTSRLQRPHWPSLAARRSRNSPNPDTIHVTRQGSLASHSASTRSDPMGSTDTMAVSENSTTVTLDTASSHSGSQPASCRAHCGSLASFDTSSVLNTDGVPLLEESELEEIQGDDTVSLAMENRSMTDNGSFKLSTASDIA